MRNRERIRSDLVRILDEKRVREYTRESNIYARDLLPLELLFFKNGELRFSPDFIVWPENREEVASLLRFLSKEGIPAVPYGGGAGVCGGAIAGEGGVTIDMKRMRKILWIDEERMTVRTQTGILGMALEEHLNFKGFTLGHFPSSIFCSTIGGFISARSAGQFSSRYGKIEDMVSSIEIITGDGEIYELSDGDISPPLNRVLCGQEGSLFINTEATLHIHPISKSMAFRGVLFRDLSDGIIAMERVMQASLFPIVLRLYDELDTFLNMQGRERRDEPEGEARKKGKGLLHSLQGALKEKTIKSILRRPKYINLLSGKVFHSTLLIIGFEGRDDDLTRKLMEKALHIIKDSVKDAVDLGEKQGLAWLRDRYSVSFKLSSVFKADSFADTVEVATTWSNLLPLYRSIVRAVRDDVLIMAHLSHAYPDGCSIYFTFAGTGNDLENRSSKYLNVWKKVMETVLSFGATISHHHGAGALKYPFLMKELGRGRGIWRHFKMALDSREILNPIKGKVGTIWGMGSFDEGSTISTNEESTSDGIQESPSLLRSLCLPPPLLEKLESMSFSSILTVSSPADYRRIEAIKGSGVGIVTGGNLWLQHASIASSSNPIFVFFRDNGEITIDTESCIAHIPGHLTLEEAEESLNQKGFSTSLPPPLFHNLPLSWVIALPPAPPSFFLNPVHGMPLTVEKAFVWKEFSGAADGRGGIVLISDSPRRGAGLGMDEIFHGSLDLFGIPLRLRAKVFRVVKGVRGIFSIKGMKEISQVFSIIRSMSNIRQELNCKIEFNQREAEGRIFVSQVIGGDLERGEYEWAKEIIEGLGACFEGEEEISFPDRVLMKELFDPSIYPYLEFYGDFVATKRLFKEHHSSLSDSFLHINAGEKGVYIRIWWRRRGLDEKVSSLFEEMGFIPGKNAIHGPPIDQDSLHPLFKRLRNRI